MQVLVAGDDQLTRSFCTSLLDRTGYGSVTAEDGQQALALLADHDVDLVLLSVAMAAPGGLAILAQLRGAERAAPSGRRQRVILVTELATRGEVARLRVAGADGCIAMPIDPASFDREIARVLGAALS